ncbi:MAG: amidase domain-containing protein [Anaerostipes sp.]
MCKNLCLKRNPSYPAFENNCTNFVSQCLAAGGISMTGKETPSDTKRLKVSKKSTDWYSISKEDNQKSNTIQHLLHLSIQMIF